MEFNANFVLKGNLDRDRVWSFWIYMLIGNFSNLLDVGCIIMGDVLIKMDSRRLNLTKNAFRSRPLMPVI
jgi:hypothetical protein